MPEILYSDIEVTAKIVMDPNTMAESLRQMKPLIRNNPDGPLKRVYMEMYQVLSRLQDMGCIPPHALEGLE